MSTLLFSPVKNAWLTDAGGLLLVVQYRKVNFFQWYFDSERESTKSVLVLYFFRYYYRYPNRRNLLDEQSANQPGLKRPILYYVRACQLFTLLVVFPALYKPGVCNLFTNVWLLIEWMGKWHKKRKHFLNVYSTWHVLETHKTQMQFHASTLFF